VDFSEGDLVVVVGSTISKDGLSKRHHVLLRVVAVGKNDVFVQEEDGGKTFGMAKSRCSLIESEDINVYGEIQKPGLGDLVLSMTDRFGKVERKLGVLMEIVDVPGKIKRARILQGETTESVSFSSLIVLE